MADLSDAEFRRGLEEEADRVFEALLALRPEVRGAHLLRWVGAVHDLVVESCAAEIATATVADVVEGGRR